MRLHQLLISLLVSTISVTGHAAPQSTTEPTATFGEDVAFLRQHTRVIVLTDREGQAQVALAPAWQGRVMTSSADGQKGRSLGWVNRTFIEAEQPAAHINVFGGEDRLWLGPEGGQFSVFFTQGSPFDLEHWFVPEALDTQPFEVIDQRPDRATFKSQFALINHSGTHFDIGLTREVCLLDAKMAWQDLAMAPEADVHLVAYESHNTLQNLGSNAWKTETGLLSIWILGMYPPSPGAAIAVPIKPGLVSTLGPQVTSDYFGTVPSNRLKVTERMVYLKGDGRYRSKIGINPRRSRGVLGSFDAVHHVLTLVQFTMPEGVADYVNSLWKWQEHPYAGDAANSYNDGPPAPGMPPLGPFYEMESSSPGAALAPGASLTHTHRTIHLTGSDHALNAVARRVLGVSLEDINTAFDNGAAP